MKPTSTGRPDVYTRITNTIIADLERGVRPWLKPWNAEHMEGRISRPLRHSGVPYRGINIIMLWSAAVAKGYRASTWLTFQQAQELGGHVRKGETGELVVYANRITRTETDANGAKSEREIPFLKGYSVFNVEQVERLPAHYTASASTPVRPSLQYGCSQSGAISAAAGFLSFQGMVAPSVGWKEQRPTVGVEHARSAHAIPVGNPAATADGRDGVHRKLSDHTGSECQ